MHPIQREAAAAAVHGSYISDHLADGGGGDVTYEHELTTSSHHHRRTNYYRRAKKVVSLSFFFFFSLSPLCVRVSSVQSRGLLCD